MHGTLSTFSPSSCTVSLPCVLFHFLGLLPRPFPSRLYQLFFWFSLCLSLLCKNKRRKKDPILKRDLLRSKNSIRACNPYTFLLWSFLTLLTSLSTSSPAHWTFYIWSGLGHTWNTVLHYCTHKNLPKQCDGADAAGDFDSLTSSLLFYTLLYVLRAKTGSIQE